MLAGWWAQSAGRPAACARRILPERMAGLSYWPWRQALVGRWPAGDRKPDELLSGLDTAISSLPAPMQQEIGELFAFLSFPPVR